MTDNLPANREEIVLSNGNQFYQREESDEVPFVAGRRIRPNRMCKVCRLVPDLIGEGYTFEEASDTEQDFYRFVYTFWSAEEISRWLKRSHNHSVSHDSISRHISQHVPDPSVAMLDRVKSYRPEFMNKKFFLGLADTMKLAMMRYQGAVATGMEPISASEFIAIAKTLKEWQEFLSELQEDKTDLFMEAVSNAIDRVLEPHPRIREEFVQIFREELERIDETKE